MRVYVIILALIFGADAPLGVPAEDTTETSIILDDFEADTPGERPANWRFMTSKDREFKSLGPFMNEKEKVYVISEGGNNFARVYTEGQALRISLPLSERKWSLSQHPVLSWDWRAVRLPTNASENRANDTGGAVYVSFTKTDWLGRPLSIKYTYSTSLPVGTVVSTGNVKIIVASSGKNGKGRWVHVDRNVVDDYKRLFGEAPPEDPFTVTLWSDSDNTKSVGEVDFDNLEIRRVGR